jgi:hypothetical protein
VVEPKLLVLTFCDLPDNDCELNDGGPYRTRGRLD